jgi:hypothetical protein
LKLVSKHLSSSDCLQSKLVLTKQQNQRNIPLKYTTILSFTITVLCKPLCALSENEMMENKQTKNNATHTHTHTHNKKTTQLRFFSVKKLGGKSRPNKILMVAYIFTIFSKSRFRTVDVEDEEYEQEATVMDSEVDHMLIQLLSDWEIGGDESFVVVPDIDLAAIELQEIDPNPEDTAKTTYLPPALIFGRILWPKNLKQLT